MAPDQDPDVTRAEAGAGTPAYEAFYDAFRTWPPAEQRWFWSSAGDASEPVLPLVASVRAWSRYGMAHAYRLFQSPVAALHVRRVHGHLFSASEVLELSEAEAQSRAARGAAVLERYQDSLSERWEREWLPEIQERLSEWLAMDPLTATPEQLARMWARADESGRRLWAIHFEIVLPAHRALGQLDELVRAHFGDDPVISARALTAGESSWTTKTAAALDEVVAAARDSVAVQVALSAPDPVSALGRDPATAPFRTKLSEFLAEYGKKLQGTVLDPSWIEDPTPVLTMVRAALSGLPQLDRGQIVAERDDVERMARAGLREAPAAVVAAFDRALTNARAGARILENHNFWLDQQIPYHARRLALASGQRLAQLGCLEDPDDIWFLDTAVLAAMGDGSGLAQVVARERDDWSKFQQVKPPGHLGGPEPVLADHPLTRRSPPGEPVPVEAAVVVGQPGSRGTVVGTVRVVRDLADAPNLLPGEVLVTVSTSPSWVPWYRLAAAVVTDAGGALAHAAIVAREFGIPAVVGARDATRRLSTGMRVEVDGTHGRVRILEAGVDPD